MEILWYILIVFFIVLLLEMRRVYRMKKITVFYDDYCSRCTRFARSVYAVAVFERVEIKKLSELIASAYPQIDVSRSYQEMPALTENGKVYYGYAAVVKVFLYSFPMSLLYPFLYLLKITGLGAWWYTKIARNRCRTRPTQ